MNVVVNLRKHKGMVMKKIETEHLLVLVEKMKVAHEAKLKELAIHDKNVAGWLNNYSSTRGGEWQYYQQIAEYMQQMGIKVEIGSIISLGRIEGSFKSELMRARLECAYYSWRSSQTSALLREYLDLMNRFPSA